MSIAPAPETSRRHAARAVDAASLIVVDRSADVPRFLMGTRHPDHRFMPDHLVFPGGRVESADRRVRCDGSLPAHVERRLRACAAGMTAARARALALCAIRETFEETGILVGKAGAGQKGSLTNFPAFAERGIVPSLADLYLVARALTPPWSPRRFDTRFFLIDAGRIAARVEGMVGPRSELVDMAWLTAEEARGRKIADITDLILGEVLARLDAGPEHDLPVPFFFERGGRRRREEL